MLKFCQTKIYLKLVVCTYAYIIISNKLPCFNLNFVEKGRNCWWGKMAISCNIQ